MYKKKNVGRISPSRTTATATTCRYLYYNVRIIYMVYVSSSVIVENRFLFSQLCAFLLFSGFFSRPRK